MALGLHPVRPLRVPVPHGHQVAEDLPGLPHPAGPGQGARPHPQGHHDEPAARQQPRDSRDDFLFLLAELGVEMENDEEQPCPGFYVPVDKEGANIIVTINSKEPFGEPDDMKFWWKIFYAAKEDWTVSSTNWEGVNWGLFSGDDPSWKEQVGRVIENARRLKAKTILYPRMRACLLCNPGRVQKLVPRSFRRIQGGQRHGSAGGIHQIRQN